jgi:hypothetical protein
MRQWMVDTKILCNRHLLGEHVEHHMFIGSINKGKNIDGFIKNNLLEPLSLESRHAELVLEMESRRINHKSELLQILYHLIPEHYIDIANKRLKNHIEQKKLSEFFNNEI